MKVLSQPKESDTSFKVVLFACGVWKQNKRKLSLFCINLSRNKLASIQTYISMVILDLIIS